MPVTVVVGGQYGSEGKGKVCAHLALTARADVMIRCGGPNAGHTVDLGNRKYELKQVPAGFINRQTRLLIAPGALVNPQLVLEEIQLCCLDPDRLGIDRNAGIVESEDKESEAEGRLRERLGSTGMGVGSALGRRVKRDLSARLAADIPELKPYLTSVRDEAQAAIRHGRRVVVEGTQGFGLSLYHTERWPYCTSRDTTAHSFLGEVGIGSRDYDVIMAIRTFPIRVGGNSGPLANEVTWEDVQRLSGYPYGIAEFTTTTKRLRRVGLFDWEIVLQAVAANSPTAIALHGADYLSYRNKGITDSSGLSENAKAFIAEMEARTGVPAQLIGTGPTQGEIIDRGLSTVHDESSTFASQA